MGLPLELARLSIDLFHGTGFAAPYLPLRPSVMTFHDASPWKSAPIRPAGADRVRRRTPHLLRVVTMVVTPTEAVRRELVERFGVPASRTAAVPLAAKSIFQPRPPAETAGLRNRLGVSGQYLLFVGTCGPRKNLPRLVEAWRLARASLPGVNLVIAGRDPGREVLNLPREPGLIVTGKLADEEIAALMASAALFVYPSLYEGFGLPVLEAMQSGTPVLTSRDPALMEVSGGAAVSVEATSVSELVRAIVELMGDEAWRLALRERGIRRAAEFSWRQTAVKTREVYVEALRRF